MSVSSRRRLEAEFDMLRTAGVEILKFLPDRNASRWLAGGHHIKIQITDQGSALFSSGNITASSHERWDEFSAIVDGSVAVPMLDSFEVLGANIRPIDSEHIAALTSDDLSAPIDFTYEIFNPVASHGSLGPLGWKSDNFISKSLGEAIACARDSVRLTSFYFKPAPALRQVIIDAARRGVRVEIFHSAIGALSETYLAWLAAASDYDELLSAGIEIYESAHGEHSKIILIDDQTAIFGSYNLEHAADDRLAEAMLTSSDDRVVGPIREVLDDCASSSSFSRVTRSSLAELSWKLRVGRRLIRPWRRWF